MDRQKRSVVSVGRTDPRLVLWPDKGSARDMTRSDEAPRSIVGPLVQCQPPVPA
jgi:hypothetical protein